MKKQKKVGWQKYEDVIEDQVTNPFIDHIISKMTNATQAPVEMQDFPEDFEELLGSLDDVSSELVRLRYVQELPYSEISRRLNIPENSIGPMLSRARTTIRKAIAKSE